MTDERIVIHTQDQDAPSAAHPIVLVLDRLRSAYNVGNIFRLGEIGGIAEIVTCGYTATPPHPKVRKTARGCDRLVPSRHFDTGIEAVQALKQSGHQIVGVETAEGAVDIWDVEFAFPVALVFGNEALGISQDALKECDVLARLPVFGKKNSLNVSNCAAVALYAAIHQLQQKDRR